MSDRVVEVTQQGFFSRLGNSIKGVIAGIVLILISIGLLFWNEGRAVTTAKTLAEGASSVISVGADAVNGSNDGRLIHTIGLATTDEMLTDPQLGITRKALRLRREVEMFQWKEESRSEERKKLGGGTETVTTYDYKQAWSSTLINSSDFKERNGHENPATMPFTSEGWTAGKGSLGAFALTQGLIEKISSFRDLAMSETDLAAVKSRGTLPANVSRTVNGFYIGVDQNQPKIGDVRIRFSEVAPQDVSVIGAQSGGSIAEYQTQAGGEILMVEPGNHTAQQMFTQAERQNTMLTWILRLVGVVLAWIGFSMIFAPLSVAADVIPIIGSIVGMGTALAALILALPLSIAVIAIAWIFFRPVLGVSLLILALAIIGGGIWLAMKKKA